MTEAIPYVTVARATAAQEERLKAFEGRSVLVTGGTGFLGSALIAALAPSARRIILVTRSPKPSVEVPPHLTQLEVVTGQIDELNFWATNLVDVDFVFHCAAQTSAAVADKGVPDDRRANVEPMLQLLEACRIYGSKPGILFAGSVTQSGLPTHLPVDETQADRPVTIYDWHKLLCEGYLEHYSRRGWIRGVTLRLTNLYGPGPESQSDNRGVLNRCMRAALRGDPLEIYGTGDQLRDYLFVADAVDAFLAAATNMDRTNGRHFVVGTGAAHTVAEAISLVAQRAGRIIGREVPVVAVEPPRMELIDSRSCVADSSAFRSITGWYPYTPLTAGVDHTLRSLSS